VRLAVHLLVVVVLCGCSRESPGGEVEVAPAPAGKVQEVSSEVVEEMPAEVGRRVEELKGSFRDAGGTPRCDVEALAELRALRDRHGARGPLQDALLEAFAACDEREARAELLAEGLGARSSAEERLAVGAAWLGATRYPEAVEVLVPLAQELGASSQAAWLAGFALFHAGDAQAALPWLEGGRAHAGGVAGSDAELLIGLAKLDRGETEAAIALLESGLERAPASRSLLAALSRAYAAAGRSEDAARVAEQAREQYEEAAVQEGRAKRLAARSRSLSEAWEAGRYEEVESLIDAMWAEAPAKMRPQLLTARVALYQKTGRSEEAARAREELAALGEGGASTGAGGGP
jgi:tetratricopeptide (TPR) repeat protein